ncbi:MAG: histidine phosphatase family protein [Clostridia bacterium]|nr:histidine phosphatase family protein [Clostridia bacterium]
MTKLYLIRHGESEANRARLFAGNFDIDLTELGYAQAEHIPEYFREIHIDAIFASDLKRAYHTACPLAKARNLPVVKEPSFREISAGAWEGVHFDTIMEKYKEDYTVWREDIGRAVCTNGESVLQLSRRVSAAITRIAEENDGKTVVIATHATPIRSLISLWATGSLRDMKEYKWVPNASITEASYENGVFTLENIGITEHLEGLLTKLPPTV